MNHIINTKRIIIIAAILVVAVLWIGFGDKIRNQKKVSDVLERSVLLNESYPNDIKLTMKITIKNDLGRLRKAAQIYLYTPIQRNGWQLVKTFKVNSPHRISSDGNKNQLAIFEFHDVKADTTIEIEVEAIVGKAESYVTEEMNESLAYLQSESLVEVNAKEIITLATQLKKGSDDDTAIAIIKWVRDNISMSEADAQQNVETSDQNIPNEKLEQTMEPKGALTVLKEKAGRPWEVAYLVTALYRASGIAARPVLVARTGNGRIDTESLDMWVEFFVQDQWKLMDLRKGEFAEGQQDRVVMRILSPVPVIHATSVESFLLESVGLTTKL